MGIIAWILFGALAGWLTSLVMKTDEQQGAIANIVLGILGAVVGGFIMNLLGYGGVDGFNIYSLLVAILGSIVLVMLFRLVK